MFSSSGSSSPGQSVLAGWYTATAIPLLVVCHACTDMKPGGLKGSSSSSGGSQQPRSQGSSPPFVGHEQHALHGPKHGRATILLRAMLCHCHSTGTPASTVAMDGGPSQVRADAELRREKGPLLLTQLTLPDTLRSGCPRKKLHTYSLDPRVFIHLIPMNSETAVRCVGLLLD